MAFRLFMECENSYSLTHFNSDTIWFSLHKKTLSDNRMKLFSVEYMGHAEMEPYVSIFVKFIYFKKATKFCEISTKDCHSAIQIYGGDFAKFCGLLRI